LFNKKIVARDFVCRDGTYIESIERNHLFFCQPCDPRTIGQLNEGRLPKFKLIRIHVDVFLFFGI